MEADKENITDGLVARKPTVTVPSPKKGAKKSRSLSMGPGALSVPLKEDSGNRRKVGMALFGLRDTRLRGVVCLCAIGAVDSLRTRR